MSPDVRLQVSEPLPPSKALSLVSSREEGNVRQERNSRKHGQFLEMQVWASEFT